MTWRSKLLQTDMLLTNDCLAQSLFLPRADSGTFSVPGRVSPGRGTMSSIPGRPGQSGTGGNPTSIPPRLLVLLEGKKRHIILHVSRLV